MTIDKPTFKFKTNLKKRIFATLLDYGLYCLAFYVYLMYFGHKDEDGGYKVSGLLATPIFLFWFIYFIVIEAFYGSTLGHLGFGLKVQTLNRNDINLTQALKRHVLDPLDIFLYGIPAIIAIRNSDKHQRIGDMWAQTIVVDTTDAEQYLDKQT